MSNINYALRLQYEGLYAEIQYFKELNDYDKVKELEEKAYELQQRIIETNSEV